MIIVSNAHGLANFNFLLSISRLQVVFGDIPKFVMYKLTRSEGSNGGFAKTALLRPTHVPNLVRRHRHQLRHRRQHLLDQQDEVMLLNE